jgi:hypothetical protein
MCYEVQRDDLIAQANADHAQYPQYQGHWDDSWGLGRVRKRIRMKAGDVEAGTLVLISPKPIHYPECGPYTKIAFRFHYVAENKLDTSLRVADVEVLLAPQSVDA